MKKKAFTLIELLVVIAIIALLMAILIPTLHRAREQGARAACLSSLRQLTLAWLLYAEDNDNKIVNASTYYSRPASRRGSGFCRPTRRSRNVANSSKKACSIGTARTSISSNVPREFGTRW